MPKKMNKTETEFANFLESQGKTWKYEPCRLDTGVPCRKARRNIVYIPDFWCPEDNCYYEVSTTPGAYNSSMKKIALVIKHNSDINIAVVNPDGSPYGSRNNKASVYPLTGRGETTQCHKFLNDTRERKELSIYRIAKLTGISRNHLDLIFHQPVNMTPETMKLICNVLDIKYTGFTLRTHDGEVWEED